MNHDELQTAIIEEEQSGEDVDAISTKSVLRLEKGAGKSVSTILVHAPILNAHYKIKLQYEAERRKSSLRYATKALWKSKCEKLKDK